MSGPGGSQAVAPATGPAGRPAASPAASPRLVIDWTRCDGHGLCAALLPGAISRDDWGYPLVDAARLATEPVAAVNRVIACCPALALRRP